MYFPSLRARHKGPMIVVAIMFFLSISIIAFTFIYEQYLTSDTQQIAQTTPVTSSEQPPTTTPAMQIEQIVQNAGHYGNGYQVTYNRNKNASVIETLKKTPATQIRSNIKNDCFTIQHALWTSNLTFSGVDLQFVGSAYNKYGNISTETLGSCSLDNITVKQFVWNNLTVDTAWDQHAYTTAHLSATVY